MEYTIRLRYICNSTKVKEIETCHLIAMTKDFIFNYRCFSHCFHFIIYIFFKRYLFSVIFFSHFFSTVSERELHRGYCLINALLHSEKYIALALYDRLKCFYSMLNQP